MLCVRVWGALEAYAWHDLQFQCQMDAVVQNWSALAELFECKWNWGSQGIMLSLNQAEVTDFSLSWETNSQISIQSFRVVGWDLGFEEQEATDLVIWISAVLIMYAGLALTGF